VSNGGARCTPAQCTKFLPRLMGGIAASGDGVRPGTVRAEKNSVKTSLTGTTAPRRPERWSGSEGEARFSRRPGRLGTGGLSTRDGRIDPTSTRRRPGLELQFGVDASVPRRFG
jgi:hypothetical protein